MGQAKQRGTATERIASAQNANNDATRTANAVGHAPHFCLILDKSDKAKAVLAHGRKGPAEIQARLNSDAVKLWETSHYPFVLIWGTWKSDDELVIPCLDLNGVLSEGLPAVLKRTADNGGLCSFLPSADEASTAAIMQKLAELQPKPSATGSLQ